MAVMHEIGMCGENGDFSAHWQENDQCGTDEADCLADDEDEEDF